MYDYLWWLLKNFTYLIVFGAFCFFIYWMLSPEKKIIFREQQKSRIREQFLKKSEKDVGRKSFENKP